MQLEGWVANKFDYNLVNIRAKGVEANPLFIPRNHLVEEAIVAAVKNGDFQPFETLLAVISAPHEDQPEFGRHALPPRPEQIVRQTFCGT